MNRYLVVSADCHAGPPRAGYREYFDPEHRRAFDDDLAGRPGRVLGDAALAGDIDALAEAQETLIAALGMDRKAAAQHAARSAEQMLALFDSKRRMERLEADGVVAEVIYPDGLIDNAPPFSDMEGAVGQRPSAVELDPALRLAGARAYNRWLADFCAEADGRRAGVAVVPALHELAPCIAELHRVASRGLWAGVLLPAVDPGLPGWHHLRYDPLWEAVVELDLPLHMHGGVHEASDAHSLYGTDPAERFAFAVAEAGFWDRRPLHYLMFGGVLERFPELRIVIAEQYASWVPSELRRLDGIFEEFYMSELRGRLSLRPSEYWARQCHLTATFMSRAEAEARHELGFEHLQWGTDYPHPEGTWPYTDLCLRDSFAGLPRDEVAAMLGGHALELFGFDEVRLAARAAEVGPLVEEVDRPGAERPADYIGSGLR